MYVNALAPQVGLNKDLGVHSEVFCTKVEQDRRDERKKSVTDENENKIK